MQRLFLKILGILRHPATPLDRGASFYLAAPLILAVALAGAAAAEGPIATISTGRSGGSYDEIGRRLEAKVLSEYGERLGVETSSGSIQNLARLADPSSAVGLALTQSDALAQFLKLNAEFAGEYIVLGDAGKECALLITSKARGAQSVAELGAVQGGEISVGDTGSGAAVTFDYLTEMNPALAKLKLGFVDVMEALLQLKVAGPHTKLRAVMVVQRPSVRSAVVDVLLKNRRDYELVPIRPSDVQNASLPDESVVYTFERVWVGSDRPQEGLEVDTICTRSLLLASKSKLDRSIRSKLSVLMLNAGSDVIGRSD